MCRQGKLPLSDVVKIAEQLGMPSTLRMPEVSFIGSETREYLRAHPEGLFPISQWKGIGGFWHLPSPECGYCAHSTRECDWDSLLYGAGAGARR